MDPKIELTLTKNANSQNCFTTFAAVSLKHKNWAKVEFVLADGKWTVKIVFRNGNKFKHPIAKGTSQMSVWRNGAEQSLTFDDDAFKEIVDQITSTGFRVMNAFVTVVMMDDMGESSGVLKLWPAVDSTGKSIEAIQIKFLLGD